MVDRPRRNKRDRLRQLRVFCAAARFESMTRAAESLDLSQRAVALQVRSLEHELDSDLFERRGPVLTLTDAGRSFRRLAEPLVEELDSLYEVFTEQRDRPASMDIEVAVTPVASVTLPLLVKGFLDHHPHVRVRVTNCPLRQGLSRLASGGVDVVVGPEVANADFNYRDVFSYDLMLVMAEHHPLTRQRSVQLDQASVYPAIMPAIGTYGHRFEEMVGDRLTVAARVAVESSGWTLLKSFVRAGQGISVIPSCCITEKDRMRSRQLDDVPRGNPCGVFTRRSQSLAEPIVDFVRTLAP